MPKCIQILLVPTLQMYNQLKYLTLVIQLVVAETKIEVNTLLFHYKSLNWDVYTLLDLR